jgi:hypothetical protein
VPEVGQIESILTTFWFTGQRMTEAPQLDRPDQEDLLDQLERTTHLPRSVLSRVVAEVIAHHSETLEQVVRRRHRELHQSGAHNSEIWARLTVELANRVVAAPPLSERQLRRIVYG